jgi:hypothetical protein
VQQEHTPIVIQDDRTPRSTDLAHVRKIGTAAQNARSISRVAIDVPSHCIARRTARAAALAL